MARASPCEIFGGYSFGIQKNPTLESLLLSPVIVGDKCHHW